MKDIIALILVAIILFFVWNGRKTASTYTASASGIPTDTSAEVAPEIIAAIVEKLSHDEPDLTPIDTVFINPQGDNTFVSRFLFLNTKHFYGTQYDVKARIESDGSVSIIDKTASAKDEPGYGYVPDKYTPYSQVQANLDAQLKDLTSKPVPEPNLENVAQAYQQNMTTTRINLETRE